jgi:excisionase family DNA binding protein
MELLTAKELASALKVSLAAVRAWTRQGIPYEPIGRLCRYRLETVLAWLRERDARKHNDAKEAAGCSAN